MSAMLRHRRTVVLVAPRLKIPNPGEPPPTLLWNGAQRIFTGRPKLRFDNWMKRILIMVLRGSFELPVYDSDGMPES